MKKNLVYSTEKGRLCPDCHCPVSNCECSFDQAVGDGNIKIKREIKEKGKGIYIVGLDSHVGFLVYDGRDYYRFVHSSYFDPQCCVSDKLDSFNPFAHSKDRVIGKLFDDEILMKWLMGEKILIEYPYNPI